MSKAKTIEGFVAQLREWHGTNHQNFAKLYAAATSNAKPYPGPDPDQDPNWKDWYQKGIDDLCEFFEEWYEWEPSLTTGLQYIQKFSWLYYESQEGKDFIWSEPGLEMAREFVALKGAQMDAPASQELVRRWEEALGDKMNESIVPLGGYKSFNQFFTRELKPGMRPISKPADDSVVVSPADAIVNMIDDDLSLDRPLDVKGRKLSVTQLLDGSRYAAHFEGGTAVSCILMPDVYHRYHAPVTGLVVEAREDVAGCYFGIDDFPKLINGGNVGYGYDYGVFENFRRGYLVIETSKYGYVAMIPVGLNTIGSVIFEEKFKKVDDNQPVEIFKGEEVGYFQYGGSLNILLFEKGCFPAIRIPQGQIIGTLEEKHTERVQFTF